MPTTDNARQLNETISAAVVELAAATDATYQDETFRAWLRTAATFHKYSWNNQLLIWSQRPTATRVAGFNTWKQFGRSVSKGEKAIHILAPMIGKPRDEENPTKNKGPRLFGFRSACVFDVSQTTGENLVDINTNATEGGETLLPRLESLTAYLDISLAYKTIPGAAEGYSKGGYIEIEETLDTPARCGVLVHELAHELLHKVNREGTTRQQRELEAESVSYVVLTHFGLKPQSHFYLAAYHITAEMLRASMETISATAKSLIEQLDMVLEAENGPEVLASNSRRMLALQG